MAGAGLLLFCTARMLDGTYPIIKSMWTGTFVLAAAGISLTFLSLFHLAVDVWNEGKWAQWAFPLRVIGINALAAYLIHSLLNVHELNRRIFSGMADLFPRSSPSSLPCPFCCCNGWPCSSLTGGDCLSSKSGQMTRRRIPRPWLPVFPEKRILPCETAGQHYLFPPKS